MRLLVTNNDTVVLLMMFRGRRFPRPANEASAAVAAAAFRGHATFHPHFPCPTFDLSRKIPSRARESTVANDHMCNTTDNKTSIVDKMEIIQPTGYI